MDGRQRWGEDRSDAPGGGRVGLRGGKGRIENDEL